MIGRFSIRVKYLVKDCRADEARFTLIPYQVRSSVAAVKPDVYNAGKLLSPTPSGKRWVYLFQ
jgi:hypothetical protein